MHNTRRLGTIAMAPNDDGAQWSKEGLCLLILKTWRSQNNFRILFQETVGNITMAQNKLGENQTNFVTVQYLSTLASSIRQFSDSNLTPLPACQENSSTGFFSHHYSKQPKFLHRSGKYRSGELWRQQSVSRSIRAILGFSLGSFVSALLLCYLVKPTTESRNPPPAVTFFSAQSPYPPPNCDQHTLGQL